MNYKNNSQNEIDKGHKQETQTAMTFRQFLLRLRDIYRPFKGVVIVLFCLLFVKEALMLVGPYIYGKIIDGIITGRSMEDVLLLLGISLGTFLVYGIIINYIRERLELQKLDFDVHRMVSKATLEKMLDFSIGQHENQNSGIKKSVIDKGEHSLTALAYLAIYDVLPVILHVVVAVVALSFLAPILGLVVFIGVIIFLAIAVYINNIIRDDLKKIDDFQHETSKKHGEILRNISLVEVNAKEGEVINEYDAQMEKSFDFAKKVWLKFIIFSHARSLFSNLTKFAVMAIGIYLVYQKVYTPGSLVIFWSWSNNAFNELNHLSNVHRRSIEMYTAVKKYFILIDVESDIKEIKNPIVPEKINGEIRFEGVSFKYPEREYVRDENKEESKSEKLETKSKEYVLRDVDISIESGQKVAIVGPSGAGKSTLVQLLVRAYDPDNGRILIDGNDLKNLGLKKFRSSLGIVPQDIALFDNTLRYNILFGVSGAVEEERLLEAVKMACIDKFITGLEKGFDTIIGERGVKLSGGERQRVGIARALIKNPSILIFDEATSSLDTENEALIRESIEQASKGRTTIIIAHRLSTIKDADKIIVVENGKIVGEGKHDELLEVCATYQRLINNQTVVVVE